METILRKSADRGHANVGGWLKAKHTFTFADYRDPNWVMFRSLRVINQDIVAAGGGFSKHPHRDMEIITYVIRGQIQHGDSMGNSSIIERGDIQIMSAGSGVIHSELNPSTSDELELLQIWILPDAQGLKPRYEQKKVAETPLVNGMHLLVSKQGNDGSVRISQDASIYAGFLDPGATINFSTSADRYTWIQVVKGSISTAGHEMSAGDGLAVAQAKALEIVNGAEAAEFLLFDLV